MLPSQALHHETNHGYFLVLVLGACAGILAGAGIHHGILGIHGILADILPGNHHGGGCDIDSIDPFWTRMLETSSYTESRSDKREG